MSNLDEQAVEDAAKAVDRLRACHERPLTTGTEQREGVAAYLAARGQDGSELDRLRQGMAERGWVVGRNPDGVDDSVDATLLVIDELLAARGPAERTEARRIVDEQAEDEALWSTGLDGTVPIAEAYLQQELRRLHAAVEAESARGRTMTLESPVPPEQAEGRSDGIPNDPWGLVPVPYRGALKALHEAWATADPPVGWREFVAPLVRHLAPVAEQVSAPAEPTETQIAAGTQAIKGASDRSISTARQVATLVLRAALCESPVPAERTMRDALERIGFREPCADGEAEELRMLARYSLGWVCGTCEGTGVIEPEQAERMEITCPVCRGASSLRDELVDRLAHAIADRECANCGGSGIVEKGADWSLCECAQTKLRETEASFGAAPVPAERAVERDGLLDALEKAEREREALRTIAKHLGEQLMAAGQSIGEGVYGRHYRDSPDAKAPDRSCMMLMPEEILSAESTGGQEP